MDELGFRAGVGLLVIDHRGYALAIERAGHSGAWQLPQGGLERGETSLEAAYRELQEETGLQASDVAYVAELPVWIGYELPVEHRSSRTGRGQTQRWFLFRLTAAESAIALPPGGEAAAWRWTSLSELIACTIAFRRSVYEMLRTGFAAHLAV